MSEQLKQKILSLLDQHRIMSIATIRPDGWPQVTTVGYVSEGLTLYKGFGHTDIYTREPRPASQA